MPPPAGENGVHLLAPPRKLRVCDAGIARFVDNVVDFAAERIERCDRPPPLRRQEHEAVVEARPALRRLLPAVFVGAHAGLDTMTRGGKSARHATNGQSTRRSCGRGGKTSPGTG